MATIKSYTDIKQSKVLSKILPFESADMCYTLEDFVDEDTGDVFSVEKISFGHPSNTEIGCWSLAALLGILPEIQGGKPVIALDDNYITYPHTSVLHTKADNLVNACYKLILKLYELKIL